MKKKINWKKEIKEILELLAYTGISAAVVFQVNYGCSRKSDDKDAATPQDKTTAAPADIIAARDSLVHNIGGKTR